MKTLFTEYAFWMRSSIYLIAFIYAYRKKYFELGLAALLFGAGGYANFILVQKDFATLLLTIGAVLLVFHVINLDKKERRTKK